MLDLEALDRLQASIWPLVLGGVPEAIDTALKIIACRAKCLGLDSAESDDA